MAGRPTGLNPGLADDEFADLRDALSDDPRLGPFFDGSADARGFWPADDGLFHRFREAGLVDQGGTMRYPAFRVRRVNGVLVATDLPTYDGADRVFPWPDEGEKLFRRAADTLRPPRRVLNLCSGAGTVALGLAGRWPDAAVLGVDNSPRAHEVAEFNRRLNGLTNVAFTCADLADADGAYDLIVSAPPFALQPTGWPEYEHSRGGELGDEVLNRLIDAARPRLRPGGRLLFLAYTLGTGSKMTRLCEKLREVFPEVGWPDGPRDGGPVVKAGKHVWRFGEEKCIPVNPMPVEYMVIRCGDSTYMAARRRGGTVRENVEEYVEWVERLKREEFTHLYYVLVDATTGGR